MPKYPNVKVKINLNSPAGNAYSVVGAVLKAMRLSGVPLSECGAFEVEAYAGSYEDLLATCRKYVDFNGYESENYELARDWEDAGEEDS